MIKSISYTNKQAGWKLEKLELDPLTLLVGVSGVGKTRILYSINGMRLIAAGKSLPGRAWDVTLQSPLGVEYFWKGEFDKASADDFDEDYRGDFDDDVDEAGAKILSESLIGPDGIIFERNGDTITFAGQILPKLPSEKSLVSTLKEEDQVAPVAEILAKIVLSQGSRASAAENYMFSVYQPSKLLKATKNLDDINKHSSQVLDRLYVAQQLDRETFNRVRDQYLEIFPNVEDIRIDKLSEQDDEYSNVAALQIKERGVSDWIRPSSLSSGMLRTLLHLCEIILLPKGSILLIDEFENSLGVNCIDVVTEELLNASNRMQFVITSHHPYVINSIGMEFWRVVTRSGSLVSVKRAVDLGIGKSSHDAFLQLMNSRAYQNGVANP